MKREIEREKRLPAFALQLGELELLWQRILGLFNQSDRIEASIKLSLPSEKIQFDSIEELKSYSFIKGRVTDFTISLSQNGRSVVVKSGGIFSKVPVLKVEGESEVWCAGAIEAVTSVVYRNRVWYWWIVSIPLLPLSLAVTIIPLLYQWFYSRELFTSAPIRISWTFAILMFAYVGVYREKLLPAAALVFSNELGFVRRYGGELGLLLGVVSIILAFLMWIFPYGS